MFMRILVPLEQPSALASGSSAHSDLLQGELRPPAGSWHGARPKDVSVSALS